MTARIVPLTDELLRWAFMEKPDDFRNEMMRERDIVPDFLAPGTMGAALIEGGRVLAAGGLVPQWTGRGTAWAVFSPRATLRQKAQALRACAMSMWAAQRYAAWRRVEMLVLADEPWAGRLANFLDMGLEGVLHAYDPWGRDYKLFARVEGDP